MNSNLPLILASNSPRRKQILQDAGITFEVRSIETDESYPDDLPRQEVAKYLAEKKNAVYRSEIKDRMILTADTTVLLDGRLLEKPGDADEAFQMLNQLSGRMHQVITGVCISTKDLIVSFDDWTEVHFRLLTEAEINDYIEKHKPYDKAGAYGIQEQIGAIGVTKIVGSYYNVMGLPMHKVNEALQRLT